MIQRIAVVNESTKLSEETASNMVRACAEQLRRDVCPAWGWSVVEVELAAHADEVLFGIPIVTLRDRADVDGAAGYHDEDERGRERGFVFVADVLRYGTLLRGPDSVSAVLSHELIELVADPFCTRWEDGPKIDQGSMYAFELADPVQGHSYPIAINGVDVSVSDFVLPSWFDGGREDGGTGLVDYLGVCPGPFQLAPGGYMVVRGARGEHSIFGALAPGERAIEKLRGRAGRAGRRGAGAP